MRLHSKHYYTKVLKYFKHLMLRKYYTYESGKPSSGCEKWAADFAGRQKRVKRFAAVAAAGWPERLAAEER